MAIKFKSKAKEKAPEEPKAAKPTEEVKSEKVVEKETPPENVKDYSGEKENIVSPEVATVKEETKVIEEAPTVTEEKTAATPAPATVEPITEDKKESGGSRKKIWILLTIVLLAFGVLGGLTIFSQSGVMQDFSMGKNSPSPTASIQITNPPSPTPEKADLEAYEIEVQNGSGIAGEGAKIKATLEKAGFKVGEVGNADNSNYDETIITVGNEVEDAYIDELTKVLEERGPVGKVEKFAEGEDGEVLVIIGSELNEEVEEDKDADPTPTQIP